MAGVGRWGLSSNTKYHMTCRIEIRSLLFSENVEPQRFFYLDILVNDRLHLTTLPHKCFDKRVLFHQELQAHVSDNEPIYIKFQVKEMVSGKSILLDSKIFYTKEIQRLQKHQFEIPSQKKNVEATIDCRVYFNDIFLNEKVNIFEKMDRIGKQIRHQFNQISDHATANKIEIFKIGEQMHTFTNRLDPFIQVVQILKAYTSWNNTTQTILITFLLSLIIFSPRISLVVICGGVFLCRKRVTNLVANYSQVLIFPDPKRLILPQENVQHCQGVMNLYLGWYEEVKQALDDPTKAHLKVLLTRTIHKIWIPVLVAFVLNVQEVLVIWLWVSILRNHEKGKEFLGILRRVTDRKINDVSTLIRNRTETQEFQEVFDSGSSYSQVVEISTKTIFVYEYQRVWLGTFSTKDAKIMDESGKVKLSKDAFPPSNYHWLSEWNVVVDFETDPQGYTYSTDLVYSYHRERNLLDVLRRRKWARKCTKVGEGVAKPLSEQTVPGSKSLQEKKRQ